MNAQYSGIYTQEASWRFAKLDELSVGFRTLRLSAPQKMPQKAPASNVATLSDFNSNQPISKIPIELLCDIFTKFVNDPTTSRIENPTGPLVFQQSSVDPTTLGQVCSHWRNAALNLPTLWSTICILNPRKSQVYRTRLWLERSGDQPLCLTMEDGGGRDLNAALDILTSFCSESHRWKAINFLVPNDILPSLRQLALQSTPCQILESVMFSSMKIISSQFQFASRECEVRHLDDIWSLFCSSPRLHDVVLSYDRLDLFPRGTPFAQLTSLAVHPSLNVEDLLEVMASIPNLRHLKATIVPATQSSHTLDHVRPPTLILKDLQILQLRTCAPLNVFFSQVILPALQQFELVYSGCLDGHSEHNPELFRTFLQSLRCPLTRLEFYDALMTDGVAERYLAVEELQHLNHLDFGAKLSTGVANLLSRRNVDGSHVIMPHLRSLSLYSFSEVPESVLVEMVSARRPVLQESYLTTQRGGGIDKACFGAYIT